MSGCLLRVVLLPLSIAMLYPLFCLRAPGPTLVLGADGADAAAIIGGVFTWWVIISWLDMRQMASTLALAGQWNFQDGERAVLAGHIQARDRPLLAPFSGEKCVGYRYRVSHYARDPNMRTREWTDFEGFALAPSVVRGPLRMVNVLAAPGADLFAEVPSREITRDGDWARAEAYLNATDFGELPAKPLADTRTRLIDNGPGDFREDKQVNDPPKNLREYKPAAGSSWREEGRRRLTEAIISEGDKVMLAGIYDAEREGMAPDPNTIMRPLRLVVGGEAVLRRKIRNRVIGMVVAGIAAVATAAIYFLVYVPRGE